MKKRNTVYEDRAEKEEKRRQKRQEELEKHTTMCPHCHKSVLDHMAKCPHCGEPLTPSGYYQPMDEKKMKKIKIVTYTIGFAIAIGLAIYLIFFKK